MKYVLLLITALSFVFVACSDDSPSEVSDADIEFTLGTMTDSRDGQTYKTVMIGSQTWMAENLNYAYTGIAYSTPAFISDSTSWCYRNMESYCEVYGRLYTWSAAMDSAGLVSEANGVVARGTDKKCKPNKPHQGICPEGWHVPTQSEYDALYKKIGGEKIAGFKLKSTTGWAENGNGIDAVAIDIKPAGIRYDDGIYEGMNGSATLLSASEHEIGGAYVQRFIKTGVVYPQPFSKSQGASLRCLKD